ncbi:hypothetical protein [Rhizobium sp. BK176]|uniref:hypothetical protein n=1 Tax=Rhizobium sp. BK176 TaxID=2587071 RepID=UPI002168B89E|nr:hypothetical protein [Rhizobium sp. BK176]MCS4089497.1 hypothetical protein [Rhizobium sp. BK176]
MLSEDPISHEIQFTASNHTEALSASAKATPSYKTQRFKWLAEARALAVQVTLDTLRPVIRELLDGPDQTIEAADLRMTVVSSNDGRTKALVVFDPEGRSSMAVGLGRSGEVSVVFVGNAVSAEQAVEAVRRRHHGLPGIQLSPSIGRNVVIGDTRAGDSDASVHAAGSLAAFLRQIRPESVEAAVSAAKSGERFNYLTPGDDAPHLRVTAAALAVDGFIAWGCVNTTLSLLWSDILTAEFAGRHDKATELANALLATQGAGYREDEASWAEETPEGAAVVLITREEEHGVRIETVGDTLTATLVDFETGSPVENIAVIENVSSDRPSIKSFGDYSARLATDLGNFAFAYLDDHHDTLCITAKKATFPSP